MGLTLNIQVESGISVSGSVTKIRDVLVKKDLSAFATAEIFRDESSSADSNKAIETIKFGFTYVKNTTHVLTQAQNALKLLTSVTLKDGTTRAYNFSSAEESQA
jgi:hypothetical protein|tara:strand:+ start:82 stop:393 length:312 start_codon:yes stop_codon:yes gene_type:complete